MNDTELPGDDERSSARVKKPIGSGPGSVVPPPGRRSRQYRVRPNGAYGASSIDPVPLPEQAEPSDPRPLAPASEAPLPAPGPRFFNFLKWLYPGMRVKRWFLLVILGTLVVTVG